MWVCNLSEVDFSFQEGLNNASSNQYGIFSIAETWVIIDKLHGALFPLTLCLWDSKNLRIFTIIETFQRLRESGEILA